MCPPRYIGYLVRVHSMLLGDMMQEEAALNASPRKASARLCNSDAILECICVFSGVCLTLLPAAPWSGTFLQRCRQGDVSLLQTTRPGWTILCLLACRCWSCAKGVG